MTAWAGPFSSLSKKLHGWRRRSAEVDDLETAIARSQEPGAEVGLPRHRNPPDGDGAPDQWEIWLRDPDGYQVVLASPDGSADGDWKPGISSFDRVPI